MPQERPRRMRMSPEQEKRMAELRAEFGQYWHKAISLYEDVTMYPIRPLADLVLLERKIMAAKDSDERRPLIEEYKKSVDSLKKIENAPERIYLWPEGKMPAMTEYTDNSNYENFHDPDFKPYLLEVLLPEDVQPVGAVVTVAGGQHGPNTLNECYQICREFSALGYQGFILNCRPNMGPWNGYECGADTARALRVIRANAAKYRIAPNHIAAAGFSNGGMTIDNCIQHYSGKQTVRDHFPDYEPDELDKLPGAPDIFLSVYGSVRFDGESFDYEKAVYPPLFMAVGLEDPVLRGVYSVMREMVDRKLRFEVHTFAKQVHGYAGWKILEGNGNPNFDLWVMHADVFMRDTYEHYQGQGNRE